MVSLLVMRGWWSIDTLTHGGGGLWGTRPLTPPYAANRLIKKKQALLLIPQWEHSSLHLTRPQLWRSSGLRWSVWGAAGGPVPCSRTLCDKQLARRAGIEPGTLHSPSRATADPKTHKPSHELWPLRTVDTPCASQLLYIPLWKSGKPFKMSRFHCTQL